ncbi:hypothetical protein QE152_g14371 [Popillia japonica]|uniref:Uncharacterized protein n=1 Tax=Popillia japonica TaxID=7064 RepID=A0AAW1L6X6_POPJA
MSARGNLRECAKLKDKRTFEVDDEVGSEEDFEDETEPEAKADRARETTNGETTDTDLQEDSELDEQHVEGVIRIVDTDDPDNMWKA